MSITTPSQHPEKTATRKRQPPSGARCTWPELLRAVQAEQTRSDVLSRYRAAGFSPDDFGHSIPARKAACDALTYAEDALELRVNGRMTPERLSMRTFRRRLEQELWP